MREQQRKKWNQRIFTDWCRDNRTDPAVMEPLGPTRGFLRYASTYEARAYHEQQRYEGWHMVQAPQILDNQHNAGRTGLAEQGGSLRDTPSQDKDEQGQNRSSEVVQIDSSGYFRA